MRKKWFGVVSGSMDIIIVPCKEHISILIYGYIHLNYKQLHQYCFILE